MNEKELLDLKEAVKKNTIWRKITQGLLIISIFITLITLLVILGINMGWYMEYI